MSNHKMKYVVYPEYPYLITVKDYDGNPYTIEVSGAAIAEAFRQEALLTKEWAEEYNDIMNGDLNEL